MPNGIVKWFSDDKGFGFITPEDGGKDLFVHHKDILGTGYYRALKEGQKVSFDIVAGGNGPKAGNVLPADSSNPAKSSEHKENTGPLKGTVLWYSDDKGFGFITPDDGDKAVFVHSTAFGDSGLKRLEEGERVSFDIEAGVKGPKATNVKLSHDAKPQTPQVKAREAKAEKKHLSARIAAMGAFIKHLGKPEETSCTCKKHCPTKKGPKPGPC